jgi:hypothetical protein
MQGAGIIFGTRKTAISDFALMINVGYGEKAWGYIRTSMFRPGGTRETYLRRMLKKAVQQGRSE